MAQEATIIGRTLAGKFRVTGVIGEGGMATVYRAVQEAEPKDVAIKVMNPELAKDSRFVRRFRREAKAAAMLKHPNTVAILEFGVDEGFVFLAMECVEGSDLALLLHRERRVAEARAAAIVMQVCQALGAAHDLHIVHRDLKPDNIMIVKKGENPDYVKVLDFGIAKILDEDREAQGPADPRAEPITAAKSLLTRVGTIVGTPAYMAPEQGRAEPVDGRTDVYACGVLLYELVTGRVPFSGETPMQVVMRHVNEPPMPPSSFLPVHPALEAVILKSLAKWPNQRQQSAKELCAELAAILPELATEKRQPADAANAKVVIGEPPKPAAAPAPAPARAPAPAAPAPAAPVAAPPKAPIAMSSADVEASTLVIDPAAPKAPAPPPAPPRPPAGVAARVGGVTGATSASTGGSAPSFPTLNIDVPEDLLAGIEAKPVAPAAVAQPKVAPQGAPPAPSPVAAPPAPLPSVAEPDSDDDVRTLVTRDPAEGPPQPMQRPAAQPSPPRAPTPAPDGGDDDPRTVVAPPRGASIPDLSQPIAFGAALPGAGAAVDGGLPAALAAEPAPTRPREAPRAAPKPPPPKAPAAAPAPTAARAPDEAAGPDKSTTLVSALPEPAPSVAKSSGPKPAGTTPLAPMKGTARLDSVQVAVDVSAASTLVPNTKPSAADAFALAATQRVDSPTVAAEVAAARARLGIEAPPGEAAPLPLADVAALRPAEGARVSSPAIGFGAPAEVPTRNSGILPAPVDVSAAAPQGESAPAVAPPAPAVVWEPKRRRLSGPIAMVLGIVIGVLLFGVVLLLWKSH